MNGPRHRSRTKKKTYVIIDEFGNLTPYTKKESSFGYGVTVTDDLESYNRLAVERRKKERERKHRKVNEVKARDDTLWNKSLMAVRIRTLGTETRSYYIDKKRPPAGWNDGTAESKYDAASARNETRNKVLKDTIRRTTEDIDGDVEVIVDYHNAHRGIRYFCNSLSRKNHRVEGGQYSSSDLSPKNRKYANALQTNDHVTNAAGSATKGRPLRALCMRMKMHRYRKHERI